MATVPMPGYVGLYEVSDEGWIKSLGRVALMGDGRRKTLAPRILRATPNGSGYQVVSLYDAFGRRRLWRLHRAVLIAFTGGPPDGTHTLACHNDGDRTNNRLSNLRWGSPLDNSNDAAMHGTGKGARATCPRGHALAAPNLRPTPPSESPRRRCLSCHTARNRLRPHLFEVPESDIQRIADQINAELFAKDQQ